MDSLEQIYSEICDGYSVGENLKFRHISFAEDSKLKRFYDEGLRKALNLGLSLEKDELIKKVKSGLWSQAKELQIKTIRNQIDALERSKKNIKTFDQIDSIYDSIESDKAKLKELNIERFGVLKNTAENYAENYYRNYIIAETIILNNEKITIDALDEMGEFEFSIIENFFLTKNYNSNYDNLKKICIKPFFYSIFNLSDKPFNFFLKPLYQLTIQQVNLLRTGETFAKIANEVPDLFPEYEGNPDKMLMFWYAVKNGAWEKHEELKQQGNKLNSLFKQLPP